MASTCVHLTPQIQLHMQLCKQWNDTRMRSQEHCTARESGAAHLQVLHMLPQCAGFPFRVEKGTVRVEGSFGPRFFPDECLHATPNTATIKHMHQTWMPRLERVHQELIKELSSTSILTAAASAESPRATSPWFVDYAQEVRSRVTSQYDVWMCINCCSMLLQFDQALQQAPQTPLQPACPQLSVWHTCANRPLAHRHT